jgi:hypothetical protein
MKRLILMFFPSLLMVLSAFVGIPLAHAEQHAAPCKPFFRATQCYYITNILNGGNEYQQAYAVIIEPGTGANITHGWTVSNTWGGQAGISEAGVSAALNFNVSASTNVSEACNANVNTTTHRESLEWNSVFIDWFYDVYVYDSYSGQSSYVGGGWAKEYVEPMCALY